jgi:hypothetical protein
MRIVGANADIEKCKTYCLKRNGLWPKIPYSPRLRGSEYRGET